MKELEPEVAAKALEFFTEEAAPPRRIIGRPFQPGESGNPAGHPQEAEGLDANLHLAIGRKGARRLARTLLGIAYGENGSSGHVQLSAIQYIYDRLEGRPRPSIQEEKIEEHRIVALLRQVTDDTSALEGRTVRALGVGAQSTAQVREAPSAGA